MMWHENEYPDSHYRTKQIIEDHLLPDFGLKPLNLITVAETENYKTKRRFLAKASTVAKELRTLNAVINRAVNLKIISDNPISIVKAPQNSDSKPHRWYSTDELDALYKVSGRRAHWWRLFANTGMRRSEGQMLRRIWVQDSIRILSSQDERTKSRKFRVIPITDGGRIALDALAGDGVQFSPT
jgi:integrase